MNQILSEEDEIFFSNNLEKFLESNNKINSGKKELNSF